MWSYGEENVALLAASLLAGIIHNHPFRQGNKRTALIAARGFLLANGWDVAIPDSELGPMVVGLAAGDVSEDQAAEAVAEHLVRAD
jgi:death-on-curing protein